MALSYKALVLLANRKVQTSRETGFNFVKLGTCCWPKSLHVRGELTLGKVQRGCK